MKLSNFYSLIKSILLKIAFVGILLSLQSCLAAILLVKANPRPEYKLAHKALLALLSQVAFSMDP